MEGLACDTATGAAEEAENQAESNRAADHGEGVGAGVIDRGIGGIARLISNIAFGIAAL